MRPLSTLSRYSLLRNLLVDSIFPFRDKAWLHPTKANLTKVRDAKPRVLASSEKPWKTSRRTQDRRATYHLKSTLSKQLVKESAMRMVLRRCTALTVLVLLGCGCALSMEQLINDAHGTGNWSHVEKRLEVESQRQARRATLECEGRLVSLCTRSLMTTKLECICVNDATARSAAGLPPH